MRSSLICGETAPGSRSIAGKRAKRCLRHPFLEQTFLEPLEPHVLLLSLLDHFRSFASANRAVHLTGTFTLGAFSNSTSCVLNRGRLANLHVLYILVSRYRYIRAGFHNIPSIWLLRLTFKEVQARFFKTVESNGIRRGGREKYPVELTLQHLRRHRLY